MSDETGDERRRPPYWMVLATLVVGFALYQVIGIIVLLATGSSAKHPSALANNINNFAFDGAFVLVALYFATVSRSMGRRDFGYCRVRWLTGLVAFLAGGALYFAGSLIYSLIVNTHATDQLPSGFGAHRHTWAAVMLAVYVCAVAPMAEEFFFRGFLFGVLRRLDLRVGARQLGPWVAALIVGVLFGLAHYDSAQPEFLIPLGFLGFLLCLMRWRTGSLYPGMVLHSINNSIAFGVNEHLGWSTAAVIVLMIGSLAVIALVTGPIALGRSSSLSEA